MEILFKNHEYIAKLLYIYNNFLTYYAWGAFGAPANKKNQNRYNVPDAPTEAFLFDCSGFAYKAIPWGWTGDPKRTYGGATYKKIPELETADIISICTYSSSDFSDILPGEVLYMKGHVGIYLGDGKAIECTSKWDNCVLISQVTNIESTLNLPYKRKWLRHGRLPFIEYVEVDIKPEYTTARLGEGLIRIARRSGITFDEIKRLNPGIKGPAYIVRLGQKVRIR